MTNKILTLEEIKQIPFPFIEVLQMNIGDHDFDDVKVCITDDTVIINDEEEEQYVVYCTIGSRNYNYLVDYSVESSHSEEEEEEPDPTQEELEKGIPEPTASTPVEPEKKKWGFFG